MAGDADIYSSSLIIFLVFGLSVAVSGTFTVFTLFIFAAALLVEIQFSLDLARAFDKGGRFAVGLIFLHPIFLCILAFGGAKYYRLSKASEKPATETPT